MHQLRQNKVGLFSDDVCNSSIAPMHLQKQPSRRVVRKWCSENMQQIYRRTLIPKCDFNKVAASFHSTFLKKHLWRAASALIICSNQIRSGEATITPNCVC